jgi:hypothetical protein
VNKTFLKLFGPALVAAMLSVSMDVAAATDTKPMTPRGELIHRIVMKWGGHVQEAYGANVGAWANDMVPVFARANLATLKRAANAPTFDAMNDSFLVDAKGNTPQMNSLLAIGKVPATTKLLGENNNDLVFVPITPCRIFDTRVAGGAIAANTVRSFDVTAVSDYSFQGGDASNCGGTGAAGSFAAAAINFTVVTPSAGGYITAFPYLGTQPLAATVNYAAGAVVGNFAVVKLDQGASANELSVYSFAQTHLVADIVGYYINPVLGPLDCEEKTSAAATVVPGGMGTQSTAACTVGYKVVSGGCSSTTFDGRVVTSRTFLGTNTHFCAFRNEGTGNMDGTAYSVCCKLPTGR